MRTYTTTAGREFAYGDDMSRTLYDHENFILKKRLREVRINHSDFYDDEDNNDKPFDKMMNDVYHMAITVIRKDIADLEGIYYRSDNDEFGDENE